ncbi:MAG: cupin domain-containing protein [Candidatus Delongbacteria bacterium]|nr:cupin domain-containing protein [Candidatus Delongbacteria bacterium]
MKAIQLIDSQKDFTVASIGRLDDLSGFSYLHPGMKQSVPGKVFTGKMMASTGAEISFQAMPAGTEIPFYHRHHQNEEIYIFLRGQGQFLLNDRQYDDQEGTMIRVAPGVRRSRRNHSDSDLVFMVIQTRQDSLESYETSDGIGVNAKPEWH